MINSWLPSRVHGPGHPEQAGRFLESWVEHAEEPSLASLSVDARVATIAELLFEFTAGGRRRDASKQASCTGLLSALTYISSKGGCATLQKTIEHSLVASLHTNPELVWERRECLPLPFAAIARLELRAAAKSTPP